MTSPPPPTPVLDTIESRRRRALRYMSISLATVPVSFAVDLLLVDVLRVPRVALVTVSLGSAAQLCFGLLAVHMGLTARAAAPPELPRPRGALAAILVGLLLAITAPILWAILMFITLMILENRG